jgi:hypothetical protein
MVAAMAERAEDREPLQGRLALTSGEWLRVMHIEE